MFFSAQPKVEEKASSAKKSRRDAAKETTVEVLSAAPGELKLKVKIISV